MSTLPKAGQLVIVRGRPAIIRNVSATPVKNGAAELVTLQYMDTIALPREESIAWTREFSAKIISTLNLPDIAGARTLPDEVSRFQAFVDSFRWMCANRLNAKRESDEKSLNLVSPFHSAVRIEDYQLKPVLKSLLMPRVSLLLADDVGLGKTIEAGLILAELYARSRVQRAMVLCPASLQTQWQEELHDKFHLDFEIIDRAQSDKIRRQFGIDSNPWQIYPRVITSMDYLRQPDVIESFRACANRIAQGPQLPWQMLIVDEAHNLAPSVFGDDSDRCRMLSRITRYFEHKLFLSATPHNGYTVTFSGLLAILDPVRIQQKAELDEDDRKQIRLMMVRRLKSELNDGPAGKRFAKRDVDGLNLDFVDNPDEFDLYQLLREYRHALLEKSSAIGRRERRVCEFVIALLTKRLLSSSYAFARTWWRHIDGLRVSEVEIDEIENSIRKAELEQSDDEVKIQREEDASRQSGSWLKRFAAELQIHIDMISAALENMGWPETIANSELLLVEEHKRDVKVESLIRWIKSRLMIGKEFKANERLIVFTEYKDTLDYVAAMLEREGFKYPQVEFMYGGMDRSQREHIKSSFNDPASPVRILIATDTAAEGLNLQATCRYVLHYEIPWNPMRLEQRNGRVDRHGQSRDVTIYHFTSDEDADLKLLSHVIRKVNKAREDLGSLGQIIDQSVIEHFTVKEISTDTLDSRVETGGKEKQDAADIESSDHGSEDDYLTAMKQLLETERALGMTPARMAQLLENAVQMEGGLLKRQEDPRAYRLEKTPPGWSSLVSRSLAIQKGALQSSLPKLVFDPAYFETTENGRQVFRTRQDSVLIRLGHPIMRRAISVLQRKMWDSGSDRKTATDVSRWTVSSCKLGGQQKTVVVVNCLAEITNNLREISHQELVIIPLVLDKANYRELDEDSWSKIKDLTRTPLPAESLSKAAHELRSQWIAVEDEIKSLLKLRKASIEKDMKQRFESRAKEEARETKKEYDAQIREIDSRDEKWFKKAQKELEKQRAKLAQQELFGKEEVKDDRSVKELEWEIFHSENQQLRQLLVDEQQRMLDQVIPSRFSLGNIELWPIAVEFIVKEGVA